MHWTLATSTLAARKSQTLSPSGCPAAWRAAAGPCTHFPAVACAVIGAVLLLLVLLEACLQ